ncbi:hypothetical protein HOO65_060433 [Ceratocystis lukuohia]|uniref:MOZ protein represents a chromatin-associated acetyltransferase n=1 Tax=Ceratocystis lukuohia TaxID=2019550 RepID=A0ABR4MEE0_9PEZI
MPSSRISALYWGHFLRSIKSAPFPAQSRPLAFPSRAQAIPHYCQCSRVQQRSHASFPRHGKAVEPPQQQLPTDKSIPEENLDDEAEVETVDRASESTPTLISEILGPPPIGSSASGVAEPPIDGSRISSGAGTPIEQSFIPLSNPPPAPSLKSHINSSSNAQDPRGPTSSSSPILDDQMQLVVHRNDNVETQSQHRHVHHFDSYSCVKKLQAGNYTEAQAITLMKAIRSQLSTRLAEAQDALLSKSDVENELYLFRAACSELSNEVKNNRRVADEQMRRERTHLQHELDILSQSLGQEISAMNDAVKGMVDDRSMSRREEHKARDSAIQQLNYKISIMLTSDVKSDIETIRWILIRRAIIGIFFIGAISLSLLRYSSLARQQREREVAEAERQKRALEAAALPPDLMQGHVPPSTSTGTGATAV